MADPKTEWTNTEVEEVVRLLTTKIETGFYDGATLADALHQAVADTILLCNGTITLEDLRA